MDEQKIPESLKDCTSIDNVALLIQKCAKMVENFGFVIFTLILIVWIMLSFVETKIIVGKNSDTTITFLLCFLKWIIVALVEMLLYKVVYSLLIGKASIVQNTKVQATASLYIATKISNEKEQTENN